MDVKELEATIAGIAMLKELGLPVNTEQLQKMREQEARYLSENIVPQIKSQVQTLVEKIHIPFRLVVEYQYGTPVQVSIVEKEGSRKSLRPRNRIVKSDKYSSAHFQKAWKETLIQMPKGAAMYRLLINQPYNTLSQLLKGVQSKDMIKYTSSLFKIINLPKTGKFSPRELKEMLEPEQFVQETSTEGPVNKIVLWSQTQKTEVLNDGTRSKMFEEDGVTPIMVDKTKKIKDGQWTIKVLCDLLFQKNYFANLHSVEQGK